jgi:hypothetical protein
MPIAQAHRLLASVCRGPPCANLSRSPLSQGGSNREGTGLTQPESKAKVEILPKEYDSLRHEVISRLNNRFNLPGYAGAIVTYAVFQGEGRVDWRLLCAAGAALGLLLVWLWGAKKIREISKRLAAIEQQINGLAKDRLLAWESGPSAGGWLWNAWESLSAGPK